MLMREEKSALDKPVERSRPKLQNRKLSPQLEEIGTKVAGGRNRDNHTLPPVQQSQELLASLSARPHTPQHAAGSRGAASLLHTTHDHAQVGRFHDNSDTAGLENFRDC